MGMLYIRTSYIYIYYMCVRFTGISKSIVSMVILILCINIYIYVFMHIHSHTMCFFVGSDGV